MEKKNFIIFLYMIFLTFSYAQHPKQNLNLNCQRKLEEKTNETILLGFENYNFSAPYEYVYFDTLFYLKNWNDENISFIRYPLVDMNFSIDAVVNYEKRNETNKFTCRIGNVRHVVLRYKCELNITGKGIPRKINIITNFTNKDINDVAKVSYVSSSAEALERELVSLKYYTDDFIALENANFTSQSPNSFKIKGENIGTRFDSENIFLITAVNGSPKKIPCSGKRDKDNSDDKNYYFLQSKGSNNLAGANLSYALLNYTTKGNRMAILDFSENSKNANGTILPPKVDYKKKSGGLSTGGIIAIVIPAVLVLLGIGALAFFLSRRAVPSPPIKNIGNNTMGVVASSEAVVHQ